MKMQNQIGPGRTRIRQLWDVCSPRRVVLYSDGRGSGLLRCGREARQRGERVVSAACEGEDRRRGRQALYGLIERLLTGEFDSILAVVASGSTAKEETRLVRLSCSEAAPLSTRAPALPREIAHAAR